MKKEKAEKKKTKAKRDELTPQQAEYCRLRVKYPQMAGTVCYQKAYPKCKTYSAAGSGSTVLMKNPKVLARIQELKDEINQQDMVTIGRLLRELSCAALLDPSEMFPEGSGGEEWEPLAPAELPEHVRRAIASINVQQDHVAGRTTWKYHFVDKIRATEQIGKYLGMYYRDNQQKKPESEVTNRFVILPTDRELTLAEWEEQVAQMNAQKQDADDGNTTED